MSQTDDDEDAVIVKLEVKSFEWRKDLSDTEYTAYMTHVQSTSRNWVVPKRFSEFRELYGTLQAHVTQYAFPTNFTWGRLSDSALEARRLQLDEFLQLLLNNDHDQCRSVLNNFVNPELSTKSDAVASTPTKEHENASTGSSYYSYMQQLYSGSTTPSEKSESPAPSSTPKDVTRDSYFSKLVCFR
jgi:hypothetical protein